MGKGNYVANSAGVVHIAKREAEADPALLYSGLGYAAPYTTYAHAPVAYAVGKSAPCVNAANIPVPCADAGVVGYHGLVHHAYGYAAPLVHSSHVGLCLNYVGQSVPC